jgi:hypothetical protein
VVLSLLLTQSGHRLTSKLRGPRHFLNIFVCDADTGQTRSVKTCKNVLRRCRVAMSWCATLWLWRCPPPCIWKFDSHSSARPFSARTRGLHRWSTDAPFPGTCPPSFLIEPWAWLKLAAFDFQRLKFGRRQSRRLLIVRIWRQSRMQTTCCASAFDAGSPLANCSAGPPAKRRYAAHAKATR